jgi:hypothetical protein
VSVGGGLALLEFVVLALSPAPPASPIAIRVELEAPPTCADVAHFYARLRARTDRVRAAESTEEAVRLRVRLVQSGGKVHGELSFMDETAPRSVDGSSCEEVVEALSLTAALALDPTAHGGSAPQNEGDTAPPPSVGESEPSHAASDSAKTPSDAAATRPDVPTKPKPDADESDAGPSVSAMTSEMSLGFEIGSQLELGTVVSPKPNAGGAVFSRLVRRSAAGARSSLGLSLAHGSNHLFEPSRLAVSLTSLTLSACPLSLGAERAVRIEPCVFASGGLLSASSRRVSNPDSIRRSFWSAGGLLRIALPLGKTIALELSGGLDVPLVQRQFKLSEPDQFLGDTSALGAFGSFGVAFGL